MRISLPRSQQQALMGRILSKIPVTKAAQICNISERTIRDWRRAKLTMDETCLRKLCQRSGVIYPKHARRQSRYWYTKIGAPIGGRTIIKKHGSIGGDPNYRKKKWYEWWEQKGKHTSKITLAKPITEPSRSEAVAEFVGIVLGDGAITSRQIIITLHAYDDRLYGKFISQFIKKLFHVPVGYYRHKHAKARNYIISRKALVTFCIKKLGMQCGDKVRQQVSVPRWIQQNKHYLRACIRGLIDTDGCVFTHRYKVKGKWYTYKKIAFTNHSIPLRNTIYTALKNLGMNPRITKDQHNVRLENQDDVRRYFSTIGSHNPKHLKRYQY